jgi:hypothetical protein
VHSRHQRQLLDTAVASQAVMICLMVRASSARILDV